MFTPLSCTKPYNEDFELATILIMFGYSIPTICASFFIFYLIFLSKHKKRFKSPFYKLFGISFIPEFIFFICDQVFSRGTVFLPGTCVYLLEHFNEPSRWLTIPYFLQYYSEFCHAFLCVIISVNRMTSVMFPSYYLHFWRKYMRFVIIAIFVLPLCFTFQIYLTVSYFEPVRNGVNINYKKVVLWMKNSVVTFGIYTFALLLIVVCTVITVYLLTTLKTRIKTTELRLCIVGIILGISKLCAALFQGYIYIKGPDDFIYTIRCFVVDIAFTCSPWSLILISSDIKRTLHSIATRSSEVTRIKAGGNLMGSIRNSSENT